MFHVHPYSRSMFRRALFTQHSHIKCLVHASVLDMHVPDLSDVWLWLAAKVLRATCRSVEFARRWQMQSLPSRVAVTGSCSGCEYVVDCYAQRTRRPSHHISTLVVVHSRTPCTYYYMCVALCSAIPLMFNSESIASCCVLQVKPQNGRIMARNVPYTALNSLASRRKGNV